MEKKYYQKPDMKAIKLAQKKLLLQDSDPPTPGGPDGGGSREFRRSWDGEE